MIIPAEQDVDLPKLYRASIGEILKVGDANLR
jgi:hypothetical protein